MLQAEISRLCEISPWLSGTSSQVAGQHRQDRWDWFAGRAQVYDWRIGSMSAVEFTRAMVGIDIRRGGSTSLNPSG
jgi:hypothetical protein